METSRPQNDKKHHKKILFLWCLFWAVVNLCLTVWKSTTRQSAEELFMFNRRGKTVIWVWNVMTARHFLNFYFWPFDVTEVWCVKVFMFIMLDCAFLTEKMISKTVWNKAISLHKTIDQKRKGSFNPLCTIGSVIYRLKQNYSLADITNSSRVPD